MYASECTFVRACMPWQVTQLTMMLNAILTKEQTDMLVLEAFFLQAIYWSLGAGLIEEERERFDGYVKFLAALALVQNPTATPGPGRWAERC